MSEIVAITTGKPDRDRAVELEGHVRAALEPVCALLNQAQSEGLAVTFQIGRNGFGQQVISAITVVKPLVG